MSVNNSITMKLSVAVGFLTAIKIKNRCAKVVNPWDNHRKCLLLISIKYFEYKHNFSY